MKSKKNGKFRIFDNIRGYRRIWKMIYRIELEIRGKEKVLEKGIQIGFLTRGLEGAMKDRWRVDLWEARNPNLLKTEIRDLTRPHSAISAMRNPNFCERRFCCFFFFSIVVLWRMLKLKLKHCARFKENLRSTCRACAWVDPLLPFFFLVFGH